MLAESREVPAAALAWQPCERDEWEERLSAAGRPPLEQAWAYGEAVATQHGQRAERPLITCGAAAELPQGLLAPRRDAHPARPAMAHRSARRCARRGDLPQHRAALAPPPHALSLLAARAA